MRWQPKWIVLSSKKYFDYFQSARRFFSSASKVLIGKLGQRAVFLAHFVLIHFWTDNRETLWPKLTRFGVSNILSKLTTPGCCKFWNLGRGKQKKNEGTINTYNLKRKENQVDFMQNRIDYFLSNLHCSFHWWVVLHVIKRVKIGGHENLKNDNRSARGFDMETISKNPPKRARVEKKDGTTFLILRSKPAGPTAKRFHWSILFDSHKEEFCLSLSTILCFITN